MCAQWMLAFMKHGTSPRWWHNYRIMCAHLFITVFWFGVFLGAHTEDYLCSSHAVVDLSKEAITTSHLTDIQPATKASFLKMFLDDFHLRLVIPLVADEDPRGFLWHFGGSLGYQSICHAQKINIYYCFVVSSVFISWLSLGNFNEH